jgi:hypothetical protein
MDIANLHIDKFWSGVTSKGKAAGIVIELGPLQQTAGGKYTQRIGAAVPSSCGNVRFCPSPAGLGCCRTESCHMSYVLCPVSVLLDRYSSDRVAWPNKG